MMQQDNLHITCTEAENYLFLFVEDELDPSCSGLLEQHLETCESCRQLEEELSFPDSMMRICISWVLEKVCVRSI